jgi:DNA-binding PadR family transcriptional regulator
MAEPTAELDPADEPQAETDGGELRNDNIYQITPEGLVAVLQQQVGEVAALKPDMTLDELDNFMDANRERLVGEAEELLEALDSDG